MPLFAFELDRSIEALNTIDKMNQNTEKQAKINFLFNGYTKVIEREDNNKINAILMFWSSLPSSIASKVFILGIIFAYFYWSLSYILLFFIFPFGLYIIMKDGLFIYSLGLKRMLKKHGYTGPIRKLSHDETVELIAKVVQK